MSFAWPLLLILLLVPALLLIAYIVMLRKRKKEAITYTSLTLIREAGPTRSAWKQHLPAALLLGSVAALAIGSARPIISTQVP